MSYYRVYRSRAGSKRKFIVTKPTFPRMLGFIGMYIVAYGLGEINRFADKLLHLAVKIADRADNMVGIQEVSDHEEETVPLVKDS